MGKEQELDMKRGAILMSDKIEVKVNIPSYEYDIHSLVKAFYPKAEVSVQVKETFETDCALKIDVHFMDGHVGVTTFHNDEIMYTGGCELPDTLTRKEVNSLVVLWSCGLVVFRISQPYVLRCRRLSLC